MVLSKDALTILLLVIADQVSKAIAVATQPSNLVFELVYNTGAAWGVLQGKNVLLLLIGVLVLVLISKPLVDSTGREHLAYVVLAAGIIGNSVDRIFRHHVVDFISLGAFPVFNLADAMITAGVVYLVAKALLESFRSWRFTSNHRRKKRAP